MLGDSVVRGVKAGSIAGFVYGLYVYAVASPLIEYVEGASHGGDSHGHGAAVEHAHAASEGAHAVSELTTAVVSVGGSVLWGILLGACLGAVYYLFEPSIPGSESVRPLVLAGFGFLTVSVVPWTVLPPAAPGMDRSLGITASLGASIGLMALGAGCCAGSVLLYRRTTEHGATRAAVLATLPIATVLVGPSIAGPQVVEAGDVPATLATAYRGVIVTGQFLVWLVLAVTFDRFRRQHGSTASAGTVDRPNPSLE